MFHYKGTSPNLEGTIQTGERAIIKSQEGLIYLWVFQLSEEFHEKYFCDPSETFIDDENKLLPDILSDYVVNITSAYTLDAAFSHCMYWDSYKTDNAWKSEGCTVRTICFLDFCFITRLTEGGYHLIFFPLLQTE